MFAAFSVVSAIYYLQFRGQAPVSQDDGVAMLQLVVQMVLPVPVHIAGAIMGVAASFFPSRRKLFGIAGVVLNLVFGVLGIVPWFYLAVGGTGRV